MTERDIIGIFGKMNSGKSSLMNLLTQQETSIVDPTPGTTADTKITLTEIHGLGPVKLMDTAGFDELDELGDKKRKKSVAALKECDLVLLVIDPATFDYEADRFIIEEARKLDKQVIVVYNIFRNSDKNRIEKVEVLLTKIRVYHRIVLSAIDINYRQRLLEAILENYIPKNVAVELLPFVEKGEFYILNIPMDEETPPGRYLRPQAMAEEYITRKWAFPVSYRMNLTKAREGDPSEVERWNTFINSFTKKPKAIITDSQAMDIIKDWAPDDMALTTFSIMMINYMSRGRLNEFVCGIKALNSLKPGDHVLIAEACNHSRIREDIGTVQIPNLLKKHYPKVIVDYTFGREFVDDLDMKKYKLVIHCGGCMISGQRMAARLRDLNATGIPITNYGIFLAYVHGEKILERVIAPWVIGED
ncbi:MAG: 50S ribosome-binding GTPase [Bacteroidia bacterium]|nr:50S ribosome-binding GTPase [Bacteroidia bacterium]